MIIQRKFKIFFLIVSTIIISLPSATCSQQIRTINVQKALEQGFIDLELTGVDIAWVDAKIIKKVKEQLIIEIPRGTLLVNKTGAQDMLTIENLKLSFKTKNVVKSGIPVICANFNKDIPDASSTFSLGKLPLFKDISMLVSLFDKTIKQEIMQIAFWIAKDNISRLELDSRYVQKGALGKVPPIATNEDVIQAIMLAEKAGIPVNSKKIVKEKLSLVQALASADNNIVAYVSNTSNLSGKQPIDFLVSILQENSARQYIVNAVQNYGKMPLIEIYAIGPDIFETTYPELSIFKRKEGEVMLWQVPERDAEKVVLTSVINALAYNKGEEASSALSKIINSNPEMRKDIAYAIGYSKNTSHIQLLHHLLNDDSSDVRRASASALMGLKDKRSIDYLIKALSDQDSEVKEQVIYALGSIKNTRTYNALLIALKDENSDVRLAATATIGELKNPASLKILTNLALNDNDAKVREKAVLALGLLRNNGTVGSLKKMLKDKNADVRKAAVLALGVIRTPKAIQILQNALNSESDISVKDCIKEIISKH